MTLHRSLHAREWAVRHVQCLGAELGTVRWLQLNHLARGAYIQTHPATGSTQQRLYTPWLSKGCLPPLI